MYHDSERCWQIFCQKDSTYDGIFVVGVMSTKIYCRPSCTARPLRKNVQFFADTASAAHAGLRPCKRCAPDTLSPEHLLCQNVSRYIESCATPPSLHQIANTVGYSPFHVQRTFKQVLGISPFGYAQAVKWLRLQQLLPQHATVHEAIRQAGFGSISSYYHAHAQRTQFEAIRHATPVTIGRCEYHDFVVIGAFIEMQIVYCGIYVDDAHAATAMQQLFGQSIDAVSTEQSAALQHLLSAHDFMRVAPAIAKDIRATAFQQRVWQSIRQIPTGQTRHYHQIAHAIGHPKAVRAVANACAQNPLAIITPCHRVVPADNHIGGYRWGATIKSQLLNAERASVYNGATADSQEH
jgi:AraC family transcriptional regulator, regulatory protein of adaptative response / methylated-DNA-[protein]-cysteine methyltransferase